MALQDTCHGKSPGDGRVQGATAVTAKLFTPLFDNEENQQNQGAAAADQEWIDVEAEAFGRDADVGAADGRHEKRRQQGNEVSEAFAFACQEDGDGPKRENGQGLIGPGKVAPDNFETVGIGQTEDEQAHGNEADRKGDEQAFAHFLLIDVEKVGQDEAART